MHIIDIIHAFVSFICKIVMDKTQNIEILYFVGLSEIWIWD